MNLGIIWPYCNISLTYKKETKVVFCVYWTVFLLLKMFQFSRTEVLQKVKCLQEKKKSPVETENYLG